MGLGSVKSMVKLAGGALLGGAIAQKFLPSQFAQYANAIAGYALGGIPGAAAGFLAPSVINIVSGVGGNGNQATW